MGGDLLLGYLESVPGLLAERMGAGGIRPIARLSLRLSLNDNLARLGRRVVVQVNQFQYGRTTLIIAALGMVSGIGDGSFCGAWHLIRHRAPLLKEGRSSLVFIGVIEQQLRKAGQRLENLMGYGLDAVKTVSSLTLFETAGLERAGALLDRIGRRCGQTLERLS